MIRYVVLLIAYLVSPSLMAAPVVSAAAASPSFNSAASLAELLLALGGVIIMIFFVAWLVRRVQGGVAIGARGMRVLATLPLSPRERLVLVQVGSEQLLLGVAPGQVNLVERLEKPLDLSAPESAFSKRLQQALNPEREA